MKMPRAMTPVEGYVYSLNDVINHMGFTKEPRLSVVDARFSPPFSAPISVPLNYNHMMVKDFLSIAGIASSNWLYKGGDEFEFVPAGDDIENYFSFQRRINAEGSIEQYEHWACPRGNYHEQPFQYRAEKTLYATQGGGTAICEDNCYVFVDVPAWANGTGDEFKPGDRVPSEWDFQPCGIYRPLLETEKEMAFEQGRIASLDCDDEVPPFENKEADAHWTQGYMYGEREKREQSAMVAYG